MLVSSVDPSFGFFLGGSAILNMFLYYSKIIMASRLFVAIRVKLQNKRTNFVSIIYSPSDPI
jgi:hypothetical protein